MSGGGARDRPGAGRRPAVELEAGGPVDATELYGELYDAAAEEADDETLGWLVSAAYGYQELRASNASRVLLMGNLLTMLGILMVLQTLFWLAALR